MFKINLKLNRIKKDNIEFRIKTLLLKYKKIEKQNIKEINLFVQLLNKNSTPAGQSCITIV